MATTTRPDDGIVAHTTTTVTRPGSSGYAADYGAAYDSNGITAKATGITPRPTT